MKPHVAGLRLTHDRSPEWNVRHAQVFLVINRPVEAFMRDGETLPASATTMAMWRPIATAQQRRPSLWRIGQWFRRPLPTLYQRCLAMHIHDAGSQSSLH
jgi:hypothetical protein